MGLFRKFGLKGTFHAGNPRSVTENCITQPLGAKCVGKLE